jgi:hypothetical protein
VRNGSRYLRSLAKRLSWPRSQAVLKYTDSYLYRKTRLSVSKLIVLKALAVNIEGIMPSEIAEWTGTERHNITALISRMKQEGLGRLCQSCKVGSLNNLSVYSIKLKYLAAQAFQTK